MEHACAASAAVPSSTFYITETRALGSPPRVCKFGLSRLKECCGSCHVSCMGGLMRLNVFAEASHVPQALKANSISENEDYTRYFDFVVIGSGIAGLRYALDVAKCGTVAIITKAEPHETNTNYAQGGVSAVLDPLDSVENHIRDTIVAGAYLCDEEIVEVVCREGPERVKELIAMGASFDQSEDGSLHLAREGGHSHHRIVHSADTTGREIERALLTSVRNTSNITMFEHHFAIDFLTRQEGTKVTCHGVDTLDTQSWERYLHVETLEISLLKWLRF